MRSSNSIAKAIYLLSQKNDEKKIIDAFLEYVQQKHLYRLLPKILEKLKYFSLRDKKYNQVEIYSAYKDKKEIVNKIKDLRLVDEDVSTNDYIKKDILGGFVLKQKGFIYDASIKNKLNKLEEALTK